MILKRTVIMTMNLPGNLLTSTRILALKSSRHFVSGLGFVRVSFSGHAIPGFGVHTCIYNSRSSGSSNVSLYGDL